MKSKMKLVWKVGISVLVFLICISGAQEQEVEVDRPGKDYTNFHPTDPVVCKKACGNSPKCKAYAYVINSKACLLKSHVPPAVKNDCCISGIKPALTGDSMQPGEVLTPGQGISSANGHYTSIYQSDGNLVLYGDHPSRPIWASGTNGKSAGTFIMQNDGNLVIIDAYGHPIWSSDTHDPGSRLVVQDDGDVVVHRPDNTPAWRTNTGQRLPPPAGPAAHGDSMQPGEVLIPGQGISSANGHYTFIYQNDGNLVLYGDHPSRPIWASGTNGKSAGTFIMQNDGNLVIIDAYGHPFWSSDTHDPGSRLVVQDDGDVGVHRPDNTPAWRTNTVQRLPPPAGPAAHGDSMQPGEILTPGQGISSANGHYTLIYQSDGNLVLYVDHPSRPIWASGTNGKSAGACILQNDGNLVAIDAYGHPIWSSDTHDPGSRLVVQDDGDVVVHRPDNTPAWRTNTVQPPP